MVIVLVILVDDCGICSEGNSGHEANSDPDCNGDCFGTAFFDACGICSEGNSGHEYNSDPDCNGDCFGNAFLDDCGLFRGNTGHAANMTKIVQRMFWRNNYWWMWSLWWTILVVLTVMEHQTEMHF